MRRWDSNPWITDPKTVALPPWLLLELLGWVAFLFFSSVSHSHRFPYGYLVTTSPQFLTWKSLIFPQISKKNPRIPPICQNSTIASIKESNNPDFVAWWAVCTEPSKPFTATFWFAITCDSYFMFLSCKEQSVPDDF